MGRIVENTEKISRLKKALKVIKNITAEMSGNDKGRCGVLAKRE